MKDVAFNFEKSENAQKLIDLFIGFGWNSLVGVGSKPRAVRLDVVLREINALETFPDSLIIHNTDTALMQFSANGEFRIKDTILSPEEFKRLLEEVKGKRVVKIKCSRCKHFKEALLTEDEIYRMETNRFWIVCNDCLEGKS